MSKGLTHSPGVGTFSFSVRRRSGEGAALKDLLKILVYFAVTIVLGALLASPLFWLARWLGNTVPPLRFLNGTDFHVFFDRAILIAAIALLFPLAKALRIRSAASLGLKSNSRAGRDLAAGLFLALLSALVLIGCAALLSAWKLPHGSRFLRLLAVVPVAAVVAFLEEALFRGAFQGALQRTAPKYAAWVLVAALFALLHFLKAPATAIEPSRVGWLSGFGTAVRSLSQFHHLSAVLGGLTTLFIVGLILGYARLRTQSLWMPIGLHAGWILGKAMGVLGWVKASHREVSAAPWFGTDLLVGLCPALILGVTGLALDQLLRAWAESAPPRSAPEAGPPEMSL